MKTILVPTDLSPLANQALRVAASLARRTGAAITLLHYVPFFVSEEIMSDHTARIAADYRNQQVAEARTELTALCQQPEFQDLTLTPVVAEGADGLYGSITRQPADLIVVASHGARGMQEWLWGSNAEKVANYAHCPVLIIKENTTEVDPKVSVFALDADDRLAPARPLPAPFDEGKRRFVYVMTPTDNRAADGIREWMAQWAGRQGLTDYDLVIYAHKNIPDGIIRFAEESSADLIVLHTHQESSFWNFFSGNVAEAVINHATLPVLVVPVA